MICQDNCSQLSVSKKNSAKKNCLHLYNTLFHNTDQHPSTILSQSNFCLFFAFISAIACSMDLISFLFSLGTARKKS